MKVIREQVRDEASAVLDFEEEEKVEVKIDLSSKVETEFKMDARISVDSMTTVERVEE